MGNPAASSSTITAFCVPVHLPTKFPKYSDFAYKTCIGSSIQIRLPLVTFVLKTHQRSDPKTLSFALYWVRARCGH
jgi:hypothetical protein